MIMKRTTKTEFAKVATLKICTYIDRCSKRGVMSRQFIDRTTGRTVGWYVNGLWPDGEYTKYYINTEGNKMKIAKQDGENLVDIPSINVEDYPEWELVEELFVDSSGFGQESEPALTIEQFYNQIKKGLGYGVIDAGQFQVHVGVFEKI